MAKKDEKSTGKKVQDDKITSEVKETTVGLMADDSLLAQPEDQAAEKSGYSPKGEERKVWNQWRRRKQALLNSRNNVYGLNINAEMRRFDKKYFRRMADIPASELDANQRPLAINNAFGKVNTALGILIDSSPEYILEEDNPKYSTTRAFVKALGEKSFRNTNSLGQFKLSVHNSAKRGWFGGRTFNRQIFHDARFLKGITKTGRRAYETRLVTKMDDIQYMNLSNYNMWLDEQTRPEDMLSTRDWMWREVWYIDDLKRTFPVDQFPNMAHVKAGGDTRENIQGLFTQNTSNMTGVSPQTQKKGMTEVYFYENQYSDTFIMECNNVMVIAEPLPQNNKKLSCTYGTWSLRGDDTIYGIGIVEAMENDEELIDRILNMDMRQLLLTISPMGFYSGTSDMEDENLRITPGVMRRTLDPKNVSWLQIPQGNSTGQAAIEWLETKEDAKTGITPKLAGENVDQPGNMTAFEVGVDREAGLKRLALPLKSLQYALSWEFYNRIALIQQTYTDFEVEHLTDEAEIHKYLDEVKQDRDFFFIENEGEAGKEKFYTKKWRMASLGVEKSPDGTFTESEVTKFFPIKPEYVQFTGFVTVKQDSLLTTSDALDQANTLRMTNLLVPLLAGDMNNNAKPAKQLLKSFNMDPKDWLPQSWMDFLAGKPQAQKPTAAGPADAALNGGNPPAEQTQAQPTTVVPPAQVEKPPAMAA